MRSRTGLETPSGGHTYPLPAGGGMSIFGCIAFLLFLLVPGAYVPRLTAASQKEGRVVAEVDKAAEDRESKLLSYSVQESYALFRRADADPAAVMDVSTTYSKDKGKVYKIISESGSRTGRFVLHKVLQNEEQLSRGQQRNEILITSRNYEISLSDSAVHECGKRNCLVLQIKAKRPSPYLLDGKIWVDATTYHIVRVEGTAAAASPLTGRPTIERDYSDIDGVPMAIHARSVSSQMLLGETVLDIKYQNYRLNVSGENVHGTPPLNSQRQNQDQGGQTE